MSTAENLFITFGVRYGLIGPTDSLDALADALEQFTAETTLAPPAPPWPERPTYFRSDEPEPVRLAVRNFLAGGTPYHNEET